MVARLARQWIKRTRNELFESAQVYTCQVSLLRRDCHACGSKTAISRLLTPAFPFLRNVFGDLRTSSEIVGHLRILSVPYEKS